MRTLQQHEQFEMQALDAMRRIKILDQWIFGGGTMLRLCFDLPRYSIDLDFYLLKDPKSFHPWAERLTAALQEMGAQITDREEKRFSFLWEIRMPPYPRRLKIEARKEAEEAKRTEVTIAHSPFSPLQVRLRTLTLEQMWRNKIRALLDRQEIRDAYDLEFLTFRGAGQFETIDPETLKRLTERLDRFTDQDFKVKLGGVLESPERTRVLSSRLGYLRSKVLGARKVPIST